MTTQEKIYRTCGRVVVRTIGDETLLVPVNGPPAGARVYPVNPTALSVWRCLAAGGSVRQAADVLAQRFAVPSLQQALADSEFCAQAFVAESLLEEQSG